MIQAVTRPTHSNSKLTLGFSSCPNDTFVFDAMVHHKIDTEGLEFEIVMEDVESLNRRAFEHELDITKISFAAFTRTVGCYELLNAGSALGKGIGPLVVSKMDKGVMNNQISKSSISNLSIAIPGKNTTANFLFSIFFPGAKNKMEMVFSEIEDAVLSGQADAGVIIHENRFTYQQKGLKKIWDLGELWEKETGEPIPLGGIVVKRDLPEVIREKLDRVLQKSVEFALAHPESSRQYVMQHAQDMDEEIRNKHIALYVNKYTIDLGEEGKHAVETLFSKALESGIIQSLEVNIFIAVSVNTVNK